MAALRDAIILISLIRGWSPAFAGSTPGYPSFIPPGYSRSKLGSGSKIQATGHRFGGRGIALLDYAWSRRLPFGVAEGRVGRQHPDAMAFTVDQAVTLIEGAHERERLAHAFLISGPRGSGKEELAARIVKSLQSGGGGGNDLFGEPVKEVVPPLDDLAGEWVRILRPQSKSRRIKVEDMRELERSLHMVAGPEAWKIGIIVDADRMMPQAENAFLKTLEEPPPRTLLLLLTGTPGALLPTVISRCVRMPLVGKPDLTGEGGEELIEALNLVATTGLGSPAVALGLKSVFSLILARQKAEAEAAAHEILKEEEKALRHAVEGDWLKRREESLKAVAESEYLAERARLFDVLQAWLADVLRIKTGAAGLDFPQSAESIRAVAEKQPLSGLLQRMDAIEDLRVTLETNAQEQLALEVGFLKAFG